MSELSLPRGWVQTTLGGTLISVIGGGTPSRKVPAYFDGHIPWFTVKDMKALKPNDAEEHISEEAIADSATNLIPANTLIVATRIALGRAIRPTVACAINQDLKALVLGSGINADFLLYWVGANQRVIQDLGSGTTVSGIRLEALHGLSLYLPPSAEQTRIVAKLEELLSELDAGVAELKAAQKKLAQYRQSLLKAAVEGALTAEWRTNNTPSETGAQLLVRILTERRARWETKQLAKFQAQGKPAPKDWQKKYPEPVPPDTTGLPQLPQGWVWASTEQICESVRDGTHDTPKYTSSGIPLVTSKHLTNGVIDFDEIKMISLDDHFEISKRSRVDFGDILFAMIGTIGNPVVVPDGLNFSIKNVALFKSNKQGFISEYLAAWLSSPLLKSWMTPRLKGTTQKFAPLELLRSLPVPLPPINEQTAITNALAVQIEATKVQESTITHSLHQSTAQRQNLLRAAFAGELVPQNPSDESASVLLGRIRAERAAQAAVKKPRGRKTNGNV